MKSVILFCSFISAIGYAENSCIKVTHNNKVELYCSSDRPGNNPSDLICDSIAKKCFIGDALELVSKINDLFFCNGDDGFRDAMFINENIITFSYGGLDPASCDVSISRCDD